jgi:predicted DNA-binding antitoxin AbrB/MazE fold protein
MTQIVTATFDKGVLRPDVPLQLTPGDRVCLTIERLDVVLQDQAAAWDEFEKLCEEVPIDSGGERLTRDQLHERR